MQTTELMRENPATFGTEMVRAILEGRKTQTRRVIKPQPHDPPKVQEIWNCPYGLAGDRIWVREDMHIDNHVNLCLRYSDNILVTIPQKIKEQTKIGLLALSCKYKGPANKIPAYDMPRWASRINLKITKIKVARLQEISSLEASMEGLKGGIISEFVCVWDLIHTKKYRWKDNPYVWVIDFTRE